MVEGGGAVVDNSSSTGGGSMGDGFMGDEAYQGKVRGLIVPHKDIRDIVHKTARFVAKHGKDFEVRIMASEEGQSNKFGFMRPGDPFHAYYEHMIAEFEKAGGEEQEKPEAAAKEEVATSKSVPDDAAKDSTAPDQPSAAGSVASSAPPAALDAVKQRKAAADPIALAAKAVVVDAPPLPFSFHAIYPSNLSALDVDTIKLTAQYTAVGGRSFLATLARKEADNERFQFLKSTHALFSYFTTLVDEYTTVLQPSPELRQAVREGVDKKRCLDQVVHRWEYDRRQEEMKRAKEVQTSLNLAGGRVDWNDFVVVETITFDKDELAEVKEKDDEDMEMDMEEEEEGVEVDKGLESAAPLPSAEESGINLVTDYKPSVAVPGQGFAPQTVIDPITGQHINVKDLSEHMRVQLLDPKWKEQKARLREKTSDTPYATGDSIASSLQAFARQRTDIFGTAAEEVEQMRKEAEDRRLQQQQADERAQREWEEQQAAPRVIPAPPQVARSVIPPVAATPVPVVPPVPPVIAKPPPPPVVAPPPSQQTAYVPPPPPQVPKLVPLPPTPLQRSAVPPIPPPQVPAIPATAASPPPIPEDPTPEEWALQHPGKISLTVKCPVDTAVAAWGLGGQQLLIVMPSIMSTVKDVKSELSSLLGGMPMNKQVLKANGAFLKDANPLTNSSLASGAVLELMVKKRGGK